MTDIQIIEQNLNAFQQQLNELKDIKVKQHDLLNHLEQLEKNFEKQVAEIKAYLAQSTDTKEFIPIEPVAITTPVPTIVEPKIEEIPKTDFVEILPEEPKEVLQPKRETIEAKTNGAGKENLNEKLAKVRPETAVERLRQTKIEDLRKSLNLNQTLAFSKTFFNGDNVQFSTFIDTLNTCGSMDAANTIIQSQIDRNKNVELYDDLINLAQRRWQ